MHDAFEFVEEPEVAGLHVGRVLWLAGSETTEAASTLLFRHFALHVVAATPPTVILAAAFTWALFGFDPVPVHTV